jgi:hypothetical protein
MADITYPSGVIPLPLIAGYKHNERNRFAVTEMDNGDIKKRLRFKDVRVDFDCSLLMTKYQLEFFQSWFANTLSWGLYWFNIDMAVGASMASTHECRFKEDPVYSLNGVLWDVKFKLEGLKLNLGVTYDENMIAFITENGGIDNTLELLQRIDTFTNVTLPSYTGLVDQ